MKMIYYGYILLGLLTALIPITYYIFQRIIHIDIYNYQYYTIVQA